MNNITILGFIASALTIFAFVPQVIQTFRTKNTTGISLPTFSLLALVSILWSVYGFLTGDMPLLMTNVPIFGMQTYILYMKVKNG